MTFSQSLSKLAASLQDAGFSVVSTQKEVRIPTTTDITIVVGSEDGCWKVTLRKDGVPQPLPIDVARCWDWFKGLPVARASIDDVVDAVQQTVDLISPVAA